MALPAKLVRSQLQFFKPLVAGLSLESVRRGQDKLGELMGALHKGDVLVRHKAFATFEGAWIIPRDERRQGVILYLHGGGYTCGDLTYAQGFGSALSDAEGVRVFCAAYRLSPEAPFPAAVEDALEAYEYLLSKGYSPRQILLCGESAGGGLCYALCLKLKELGREQPCGIVALSPWTDLTASGDTYEENEDKDPSLTREVLDFYAHCYAGEQNPATPLMSPLFGDLQGLPPSLILVGGDEILLDDSRRMHKRLLAQGCKSRLRIAPGMWHTYLLYPLEENEEDMKAVGEFMNRYLCPERKLRWMRLDNAAKIYPAARRRNWNNFFRLSATLTEPVDRGVLQSALDVTVRRFPSMAVRLRKGIFWYYLEELSHAPAIGEEKSWPLAHVPFKEIRACALRVLVYKNRIALEIFHALTDGSGALVFLKTLLAEYLTQKYGVDIPNEEGVLCRLESPSEEELEDSFLKYAGAVRASRGERTAYHLTGTREPGNELHLVTLMLNAHEVRSRAKECGVTITEFLSAAMLEAILQLQEEKVLFRRHRKPVKVLIPVNLRKLFPSKTLRNFALYVTPEVDPQLGEYSFEELCRIVHHRMGLDCTAKLMGTRIAANVSSEQAMILKIMPLFIKNIAMKAVFDAVGERKSCLCLSNLGLVTVPAEMERFIERMDFVIGPQARAPHNCGVLTYGDTMYINMIRNIREPELELKFFQCLQKQGLKVKAESN